MRLISMTCAILLSCVAVPAVAAERFALVIGNASYEHARSLKNPLSDASAIALKLEGLGFQVTSLADGDLSEMRSALKGFVSALSVDDTAVFYFAGHGLQIGNRNHLLPIDAALESQNTVDLETLPLDFAIRQIERAAGTTIVFVDACRNNPLEREWMAAGRSASSPGFLGATPGSGTLISFATEPGAIARDGAGAHSPFTRALIRHIARPGLSINDMLIDVRRDVLEETKRAQVPWERSALIERFSFVDDNQPGRPALTVAEAIPPIDEGRAVIRRPEAASVSLADLNEAELHYWETAQKAGDERMIAAYLLHFPDGTYAPQAEKLYEEKTGQSWTDETAAKVARRLPVGPDASSPPDEELVGTWRHDLRCDFNAVFSDLKMTSSQTITLAEPGVFVGTSEFRHTELMQGEGPVIEMRRDGNFATYLIRQKNTVTGNEAHIGVLNLRVDRGRFRTTGWEMNTAGAYCEISGGKE